MRLVAAMGEPRLFKEAGAAVSPFAVEAIEDDARYYRRRSTEEDRAAAEAAGPKARSAHLELARRYARLSRRKTWTIGVAAARRGHLSGLLSRRFGLPEGIAPAEAIDAEPVAERRRRLDDLLDEALLETFPASDPVSIVHIG
jgi:hypothetical protein